MNQKEIKELVEFLIEKDIAEFELERGDVKLKVKRGGVAHVPVEYAPMPVTIPAVSAHAERHVSAPAAASAGASSEAPVEEGLVTVKSPIVGTFYEAPSPGAPPFFSPGDHVKAGQVLCIIEAMKLMNEIEAEVSGEVVKRLINNGQPVEYGQGLFLIRPQK